MRNGFYACHEFSLDLLIVACVEWSSVCIFLVELMLPLAFEVNGIHQIYISIGAQRIRIDEFVDFAMGFLSHITINDLSTFHRITEIQRLNASSELVGCNALEVSVQTMALLNINFICQVELSAANVSLQLFSESVILIGHRDFVSAIQMESILQLRICTTLSTL